VIRRHLTRIARHWACASTLLLVAGCNAVFDISKGPPRPRCADELLIDDLEDGDESICPTNGREGNWFGIGDGTIRAELTPASDVIFEPTLIEEGPRGTSRPRHHGDRVHDHECSQRWCLFGAAPCHKARVLLGL
jgi:hypothetical protein